jgi:protein-S-isoprenylcysteine O-methyltransferase Ste14
MNLKSLRLASAMAAPRVQTLPRAPDAADSPPVLTATDWATEIAIRLGTIVLLSPFFILATRAFLHDHSRVTLVMLMFTEAVTLLYALCTRVPRQRDWNPLSVVLAVSATYYLLAFSMAPGLHLIPEKLAAAIQLTGFLISLWAKLSLRRSFGILPANRGVVTSGIYRFIRHPMYCGYFVRDLGFLLPNFGWQNLLVVIVHWSLQTGRILREERVLKSDAAYGRYAEKVRFRILPGVF